MIIARALYGLTSSEASFRAFLVEHVEFGMGFRSSIADLDKWIRPATEEDGEEYYEYILLYVDDVLLVSNDTNYTIKQVQEKFTFKGDKWEDPEIYLGARIEPKKLNNTKMWSMY